MCGIFGCVGRIEEGKAWECIRRIEHRGPDAIQVKKLEGITLAHARLAIIDVSEQANQPLSDERGRYWIVFNGEIYNYKELRRELQMEGYSFQTQSDTEVLLKGYMCWGEEVQNKCNGMWAVAIWDAQEKKLFLSRDRFGIKPLYYYEDENGFYFASEMKSFFPIMSQKQINYRMFDKRFQFFSYEKTEECTIKGIRKVSAGKSAIFSNDKLLIHNWWNTLDNLINVPTDYCEQVEMLQELFLDACKIRMRSDVPIGTALSGGIDSSAIVGAMSYLGTSEDRQRDWQNVFVASMPYSTIDETEYAKQAAAYVGANLTEVLIHARITPEEVLHDIYMCENPLSTMPRVFMQTYKAIKDAGISVTLDGHGADELFGGYLFDLFYYGKEMLHDENELLELCRIFNDSCMKESQLSKDDFLRNVSRSDNVVRNVKSEKLDTFNKVLYAETHRIVMPTLMRCYDSYSMANGVEIRMPFLDYRIACFAFSISMTSKLRNGYTKAIVRDMARPFMTKNILERKLKIGFNSPLTEWFHSDLKEFLLDTINSKDFYECELINPMLVKMSVQDFYLNDRKEYTAGETLWGMLSPYLWKKAVIDYE